MTDQSTLAQFSAATTAAQQDAQDYPVIVKRTPEKIARDNAEWEALSEPPRTLAGHTAHAAYIRTQLAAIAAGGGL